MEITSIVLVVPNDNPVLPALSNATTRKSDKQKFAQALSLPHRLAPSPEGEGGNRTHCHKILITLCIRLVTFSRYVGRLRGAPERNCRSTRRASPQADCHLPLEL